MTIPKELKGVLDADPKIISGAVRFVGQMQYQQNIEDRRVSIWFNQCRAA